MTLPGRLVPVDGVRVFLYRGEGAGLPRAGTRRADRPPVLLVHGWLMSHWAWRKIIPALVEAGHDVIAPDLPGFGESDRPAPAAYRYDTTAFSDTLSSLLDRLEVPKVSIVGSSLGGAVGLAIAARHPERVDRLAVIAPAIYPAHVPARAALMQLPGAGRALFRAAMSRPALFALMRRDIYLDPAVVTDAWVDFVWDRVNRPGGIEAAHTAMLATFAASRAGGFEAILGAVRAPTHIIWGEHDRLFPARLAERLRLSLTAAPQVTVAIIPTCGHAPAEERPDQLGRELVTFLGGPSP
jgi:pimeloyl-ACP methyl ester carboxylesterase